MSARPPVNKWLVTLSVTFGTLMGAIDSSIVAVALPQIRGAVGATIEEITWITTAFVIATVLVMPLTAFLGSFLGQKRVYMASLVLFIGGSALCGTARSLGALAAFRAIQGLGAGALQPTEQAILRQTFPPKEQGMAMALFAMAVMIGPAVGPTLGGYITDHLSWPWIFYINLPVGILGLTMVYKFVHEPDDIREANRARAEAQKKHMDWAGIALLCMGVASLQFFLEEGEKRDWFDSNIICVCAFVAFFGLAAFVIRELTAPVPVVNVRLFKDKAFLSGTLIGALMFAMLLGSMFLLPLFMQELLGFTATQSGLTLMPRTLAMMVATPFVGRFYNKIPPAAMIAVGVGLFCIGSIELSHLTLETSGSGIISALVVTGFGFSFLFVPLTTAALSAIPRANLTDATGLNSLFRQIGGSIGLTIFATLLTRFGVVARAGLASSVSGLRPEVLDRLHSATMGMVARGADPATARAMAIGSFQGRVQMQSTVLAFDKAFLLQAIAFLAVLPLLFFLKVDRTPNAPKLDIHVEA
jgi:MFS transporter, DHA2 family, multidrug resistance protein